MMKPSSQSKTYAWVLSDDDDNDDTHTSKGILSKSSLYIDSVTKA